MRSAPGAPPVGRIKEIIMEYSEKTYEDYFGFFDSESGGSDFLEPPIIPGIEANEGYRKAVEVFLKTESDPDVCILGIDIYRYSQYENSKQKIIPFLLHLFLKEAFRVFKMNELFISEPYDDKYLETHFVDTGDGGFLIFETPLDALLFMLEFNFNIHIFNSFCLYPKLREYLGPITFRTALTFDKIYRFSKNWYGSSIIKCSRILSLDKLNRCLIDENCIQWFAQNTKGIENLKHITIDFLKKTNFYADRKAEMQSVSLASKEQKSIFEIVICQKISDVQIKEMEIPIYSLYIQIEVIGWKASDKENKSILLIPIGNLNTQGLQ